eukprot:TRINITY_DN30106_c0_g1_i1.p1 TRINITY_DN30106_c0_g1~~TRINITY_DN30106_c0_g1_i1.p1  ORF type:complete len:232 (+),score=44.46 TRINITY_DN30106_c0_g1_i1:94-696(+)
MDCADINVSDYLDSEETVESNDVIDSSKCHEKSSASPAGTGSARTTRKMACRKAYRERRNRLLQETCAHELLAVGTYCSVSKHARLGCAIATFETEKMQLEVLAQLQLHGRGDCEVTTHVFGDVAVTVKPHRDRDTQEYDRRSLFIHWGHSVEKNTPLPVQVIQERMENISREIVHSQSKLSMAPSPEVVPLPCLLTMVC